MRLGSVNDGIGGADYRVMILARLNGQSMFRDGIDQ